MKRTARTTPKSAAKIAPRGLRNRLRGGLLRNGRRYGGRTATKDPIDVVTGEVILQQTDAEFPGILPLVLERTHISTYREGNLFGPNWASTLDQHLETDGTDIVYYSDDGMKLLYPVPAAGTAELPEEGTRLPLTRHSDGTFSITDRDNGRTLTFTASADHQILLLKAISDRNGNRVDLSYDDDGIVEEISHSGGYTIAVAVSHGKATALRLAGDEETVLVRYGYDEAGYLSEVINSSGEPQRFSYDDRGRMTGWTDRNGHWYRYTYDGQGRGIRGTGSDGYFDSHVSYGDDHTVVTDSLGHRTTYEINTLGQVVAETDPLGNTTRSEWDLHDRLLARTDPLGATTLFGFDEDGNLSTVTRPDERQITARYNELGLPVEAAGPDGATWRQAYDPRGNLVSDTDPLGQTTVYAYDEQGRLTSVTDALGHVTRVECDRAGMILAVTDPAGGVTRCRRDAFGRVVSVAGPAGDVTRFTWTIEGRLASRTSPDGSAERWEYDAEENLIAYVDAAGQATSYAYTAFDQRSAETGPDEARMEFSYDTELRLVAVTNPQGMTWRYEYDEAGNLIRETDFDGRTVTYACDAAGQLAARVNGTGQETRYVRNALGEVIEQHSPGQVTTFSYDPAGQLIRARNNETDLRIRYDALGQITAETCDGRTVRSAYDAAGQRVRRVTASGVLSEWTYGPVGRPAELRMAGEVLTFGYDAVGRETERRIGLPSTTPGAILGQRWDPAGRLAAQTLWGAPHPGPDAGPRLLQDRRYAYRPDGYLSAATDQYASDRQFALDPAGRVTAVNGPDWSERYAYDPGGNLRYAEWPAPAGPGAGTDPATGAREYAGMLIRRAGNVRYEHDSQGRVVLRQVKTLSAKPRTWRFNWNDDDQLTEVRTPDGKRWRYRYDPLGRRVAKQRLGDDGPLEETVFVWDGDQLAEQISSPGATRVVAWEYEPGTHRPLAQVQRSSPRDSPQEWFDEQFHAIVADLAGYPAELVDPAGHLGAAQTPTLWGQAGRGACPLGYPGQYHDPETGLFYNYHRYYDPATGRYQSPDPLGLTPQPNPYAYVHNPTGWIDPHGLMPYRIPGRGFLKKEYKWGQVKAWIGGRSLARWHRFRGTQPKPNATVRDLLDLTPGNKRYPDKRGSAATRPHDELMSSIFRPKDYQYMTVNPRQPSVIFEGNHRRFELMDRVKDPNSPVTLDTEIYIHRFKRPGG